MSSTSLESIPALIVVVVLLPVPLLLPRLDNKESKVEQTLEKQQRNKMVQRVGQGLYKGDDEGVAESEML